MSAPTQNARILTLLTQRGERGITAMDMLSPTADGGPPVMRLPSRIDELRRCGYRISSRMIRTAGGARVAVYVMTPADTSGRSARSVDDGAPSSRNQRAMSASTAPEPLTFDVGGTVQHRPRSPLDPEVA